MALLQNINRIAVFRALQLGDTLCAIPAVRAVRHAYPKASITLIGLPWQRKMAERFHHYFDDFIIFPGWPGLPEQEFDPSRIPPFLSEVQARQFDLVLQMQGDGVLTNPMCLLFGGKHTAGLRLKGHFCPDEKFFPVFTEREHEVLRFLKLVEALDIPLKGTELEFPVTLQEVENFGNIVRELSLEDKKYVCVHPGSKDPLRRWSQENFAYVADALADEGYTIVITGSEGEKEITASVAEKMKYPAIDTVQKFGTLGLGELALLLGRGAALVSNDTGVSHIAAALKTPSVIVYSPYSDPQRWAPLDTELHKIITYQQSSDPEIVLKGMLIQLQGSRQEYKKTVVF